jgi:hypothetical protein
LFHLWIVHAQGGLAGQEGLAAMQADDASLGWREISYRHALLLIGAMSINLWGLIVWGLGQLF